MKTFIFTLIFSFQAFSTTSNPPELTDPQIARQLTGVAQDIKNEEVISRAPDLKQCQEDYQKQSGSIPNNSQAITALENCIKQKIANKTGDALAGFSDKLNLETYNLIPSKSIQNITKYLTQKLYQSLTGVDMEEKDVKTKLQAMKFNNKKQINHSDFYDLYKNQVAKNALAEVSRFCLIDFRNTTYKNPGNTFIEHWNNLDDFTSQSPAIDVTDNGAANPFGNVSATPQDTEASYREIMKNIFKGDGTQAVVPDEKKLNNFFFFCGRKINELCDNYEKSCATGTASNRNCTGSAPTTPTQPGQAAAPAMVGGAKACIAKTRLMAYKKAMAASDEIVKGLRDNAGADIFLALDKNEMVKRYERGAGAEKSLNELTNNASIDFYKATQDESTKEAEECVKDPSQCDQFVVVSDAETRIEQNTNLLYLAKRQAEMKRVKELQGQALDEYLEKNYPDLKDQITKNPGQLEVLIGQRWDARREAVIKDIQDRISARQVTESEDKSSPTFKTDQAQKNAQESLSEKTRLAQVVFFNNIISSSLSLQSQAGKNLGRNLQAIKNEVDSADSEVNGAFSNLRQLTNSGSTAGSGGGNNGLTGNESVTNIEFLDQFIGIPEAKSGNSRNTAGSGSN